MTARIVVASQKGGVGKTTVTLNLATALAERGHKTLIVDLDPQGGIGLALGRGDTEWRGLADLMMGQVGAEEAVLHTKLPGLSILPRGRLDPVDACDFEQALFRPGVLEGVLGKVETGFDLVLVDTPAGMGMVTRAALISADFVLVPWQAEPLALRSIAQVLRVIEQVREGENPKLELLGILPTMVDFGSKDALSIFAEIRSGFAAVLETAIPKSDAFVQASLEGLPLGFLGGPAGAEGRRFGLLAEEVTAEIDRFAKAKGRKDTDGHPPRRELV